MTTAKPPTQARPLELGRALRMLGRALLLRCPNCGGRGIFSSWFTLRDRCPTCALPLQRGEPDYFIGAYLINLVVVELLFAIALVAVLLATWPDPPWTLLEYGGAALMLIGALVSYPFSKTTWLAVDLSFRPATEEELTREAGSYGYGANH